jgi:DNA-binding response OmpR family regulator
VILDTPSRIAAGPRGVARLTRCEFAIIAPLHAKRGNVVPRREILERWPGINGTKEVLQVHLHNLRAKLRGIGVEIEVLKGEGMRLKS